MREDQEFNIYFVGLVEAHPCLYDFTREDYRMSHIQERTWAKIAKQIGEGASVAECKGRWKNLRGNYTKHLKKCAYSASDVASKRPYYLAVYMTFLLPFTKTRKPKGNIEFPLKIEKPLEEVSEDDRESEKEVNEKDTEEDEDNSQNDSDENWSIKNEVFEEASRDGLIANNLQVLLHENNHIPPPHKIQLDNTYASENVIDSSSNLSHKKKTKRCRNTFDDLSKTADDIFENKKKVPHKLPTENDADEYFLLSLLPDLRKMSDKQKRKFKVGILNLADEIFDDISTNASASHSPNVHR